MAQYVSLNCLGRDATQGRMLKGEYQGYINLITASVVIERLQFAE
jgi:hypothetical protein